MLSEQDKETLNNLDAFDMLERVLEEPSILNDADMLEAFREQNRKLNTGEVIL